MSGRVVGWAAEQVTGSPVSKLVLFKLADNANDEGSCWPSIALLAEHTELGERTVQEHLKRLEARGLIRVERRVVNGVNLPNVYHLAVPAPARRGKGVAQEPHQGDGAGAAPLAQQDDGDSAPPAGGVVQETARHIEEPSIKPSGNRHSPAPGGARESGDPWWEKFRLAVAQTWPSGFPMNDEGRCERVFAQLAAEVGPETLVGCASLHGDVLGRQAAHRNASAGPMLVKRPSNWLRDGDWKGYRRAAADAEAAEALATRKIARVAAALGPKIMEILRDAQIGDAALAALDGMEFEPGPPPVLVASRGAQLILLDRHIFRLQRALGEDLAIVLAGQERRRA